MVQQYRTELLSKFYNDDERQLSGQVVGINFVDASVLYNWREFRDKNNAAARGVDTKDDSLFLDCYVEHILLDQVSANLTKTPKYAINNYDLLEKPIAFPGSRVSIQPTLKERRSNTSASYDAKQFKELQMAKTAVFDSENELINVYESGKAAKTAHKGQTDVKFVTEKDFAPIGQYDTVESLFPKPEKPVKEKAEGAVTRSPATALTGAYTVVKADGVRFTEGDERGLAHSVLVSNSNFEDYLAAAPKEITFETSRGAKNTITPTNWARYALRRGWIKVGDVQVVVEAE
jgi:hypothetical protein